MSYKNAHPEQDPAEGSREAIDRELARQTEKQRSVAEDKIEIPIPKRKSLKDEENRPM